MNDVTEKELAEIDSWRKQLLKEIRDLEVEVEVQQQDLKITEIQAYIIDQASIDIPSHRSESFRENYVENIETDLRIKRQVYDTVRSENNKKRGEITAIISTIEAYLKSHNYTF